MKKLLTLISIIMLSYGCQNQTNTVENANQVGTIEANDSKSTAARDFSNAYTSNNLLSAKSLFTEDAVFKINDAEMSFDDMAAGFTAGHNYFDNIRINAFGKRYYEPAPKRNVHFGLNFSF